MTVMGDFADTRRATGVLLPYQARWVEDGATVKVIEKSRRVGISWAEASDDALYAAQASGDDVWYIGYNQDMAQEFINDCGHWARHYNLAASPLEQIAVADEDKDILAYRIRFASGHRIVALSSRPTNLRGKQGRVVIDEAAFHDDLAGLLKAAMALTMWGGQVRIISTHNGEANPFNELITEIRAGKKPFSLHRVTLDDALGEGLYRRICQVLGRPWSPTEEAVWRQSLIDFYGEDAQEELFVIPSQGSGVFLSRLLIEACMDPEIPVLRWACDDAFAQRPDAERAALCQAWLDDQLAPILARVNPQAACYVGGDFGRSAHLSAFLPLVESLGLVYRAPCLVELRNVTFKQQEQILFYLCDRLPRFRGAALDARGNGQYLAEVAMQRYGARRVQQIMPTLEWYREAMPKYKAAFEDRTIWLPRDADVLDDHRALKVIKGVAKLPDSGPEQQGRDGKARHGDTAIAGAMAIWAAKTSPSGPVEYQSAGKRALSGSADPQAREESPFAAPRFGKGCW